MPERTVYMCDPDKNVQCPKTGCGYTHEDGPCFRTSKPECAITDMHGEPVIAKPRYEGDMDEKGGCNGDYCEL